MSRKIIIRLNKGKGLLGKKITIECSDKRKDLLLEDLLLSDPFWVIGDYIISKSNITYIRVK